jgi:hypothetical protein
MEDRLAHAEGHLDQTIVHASDTLYYPLQPAGVHPFRAPPCYRVADGPCSGFSGGVRTRSIPAGDGARSPTKTLRIGANEGGRIQF